MTKETTHFPQLIIANQLSDGLVVWLSADGNWTGRQTAPLVVQDSLVLQQALSSAQKAVDDNLILDPIAIPVSDDLVPDLPKHKILLSGPTVRTDLGWQADTNKDQAHVSV